MRTATRNQSIVGQREAPMTGAINAPLELSKMEFAITLIAQLIINDMIILSYLES
jgi:hypothetical protein